MFEKAVNKYFGWRLRKRVLIFAILVAIMFGVVDMFAFGGIQILFPKQEIYSYLDNLATNVIKLKSTDFLRHLDNLDYLNNLEVLDDLEVPEIYEKSYILNYYTVTEDSKENTITINLYGYHCESLTLVVSRDYKLISLDKFSNHRFALFVFSLIMIVVYYVIGTIISLIINLVLIGIQKIAQYCSRIRKYFSGLRKNKKAKSETESEPALNADCEVVIEGKPQDQGNQGSASKDNDEDDDDTYYAEDYDEM